MDGRMDRRTDGRTDGRMDGRDGRTDEWTAGRMNGRMDGWDEIDGWVHWLAAVQRHVLVLEHEQTHMRPDQSHAHVRGCAQRSPQPCALAAAHSLVCFFLFTELPFASPSCILHDLYNFSR